MTIFLVLFNSVLLGSVRCVLWAGRGGKQRSQPDGLHLPWPWPWDLRAHLAVAVAIVVGATGTSRRQAMGRRAAW